MSGHVSLGRRVDDEYEARLWAQSPFSSVQELIEESRYHAYLAMHSTHHNREAEANLARTFAIYAQMGL